MGGFIDKAGFPFDQTINFDEIIDVRSPVEFSDDHISGAINLPVLSNSERAEVGTVYKQISAFDARCQGASLVSRNIANHIDRHFSQKDKNYRPLIYCWRGGQRSESMAQVLSGIGWHVWLLEGGYRTYRREIIKTIDETSTELNFVVLNGLTGAGKTRVLKELKQLGEQVLELEGIARHKGSVFGGDPDNPQPAQKRFESLLYDELISFEPDRPVFIEAESAKIGKLNLPNPLWQRMKCSPVVELVSPLPCRANFLKDDYAEWLEDTDRILDTIDRLKGFHSDKLLAGWKDLASNGEWRELISSLLSEHYDHRYRPDAQNRAFQKPKERVEITQHDAESLKHCAESIQSMEFC